MGSALKLFKTSFTHLTQEWEQQTVHLHATIAQTRSEINRLTDLIKEEEPRNFLPDELEQQLRDFLGDKSGVELVEVEQEEAAKRIATTKYSCVDIEMDEMDKSITAATRYQVGKGSSLGISLKDTSIFKRKKAVY